MVMARLGWWRWCWCASLYRAVLCGNGSGLDGGDGAGAFPPVVLFFVVGETV